MPEYLKFSSRSEFRNWLETNCMSDEGVWLLFGKAGGPKTIKAGEALEEALCYGWIDGQMQSLMTNHMSNISLCAVKTANGPIKIRPLLKVLKSRD